MGMMDYLIGKNVGREEARNSPDSGAAHHAEMDAIQARSTADQAQNTALAIALALKQTREELGVMRKRFYKERQKRLNWQVTAEARKLSLLKHGLTDDQILAEQRDILADTNLRVLIDQKADAETAKIDAEFGMAQETSTTTQETNNPSFQ